MALTLEEKRALSNKKEHKKAREKEQVKARIQKAKETGNYREWLPDTQRQRVYESEWAWNWGNPADRRISMEEAKEITEDFLAKPWVIERFGPQETIEIKPGRGGKIAWAYNAERKILFPEPCRYLEILIHEIAHILSPFGARHGHEFCETFLYCVRHYFGEHEARVLANEFDNHYVEYGNNW